MMTRVAVAPQRVLVQRIGATMPSNASNTGYPPRPCVCSCVKMIELGFTDAGYTYLNLDDGWAGNRTADGTLTATGAFTGNSLKSLADFAHAHGMKLGTYTDRGTQTCGGRPGAQDHETQDAATYASWGVDYLKEVRTASKGA